MKKILLIIALCIASLSMFAQGPGKPPSPEKSREFMEFKIKYLAQEMELKADQRERFTELYEKMWGEKRQLFSKAHQMEKKLRSGKDVTDEDYDRYQDLIDETRAKDLEIDKRYDAEFLKFISKKQLFKMKDAERKFMDRMREMRVPGKGKKHKVPKK
ncbi:MAG: hypothetical protein HDR95_02085 [Bacteroides sp.]|nr:hypothetical protein [Bacteroidales bacterium]MBD5284066.1 hypothetical protein [Bacteroides sp.]MBD5336089.1 hypothetical protein [Bacteroides sp.]